MERPGRHESAAVVRTCRSIAPEAVRAARFLPRPQREAVQAVIAFADLLASIIEGRSEQGSGVGGRGSGKGVDGSEPQAASPKPQAAPHCSCDGGSLEGRRLIAGNVIDYLWEEAKPGEIGRAEMEAFLLALHGFRLSREPFDRLADGLAFEHEARRFATWNALRRHLDRTCTPFAEIVCEIVAPGLDPDHASAARTLSHAVGWTRILFNLRRDWDRDRLFLPLEDLARHGLRDREFGVGDWGCGHRGLFEETRQRAETLFEEGSILFDALPIRATQAAAMYLGQWKAALREWTGPAREDDLFVQERLHRVRFTAWRRALIGRV